MQEGKRDWSGTGRPEDAHLPDAEVRITLNATTDLPLEPPMTTGLRTVCVLVWTVAALFGGYGVVRLFAAVVGLLAGAPWDGVILETLSVGLAQVGIFAVSLLGVWWTIERRIRGAVALSAALCVLAAVGLLALGAPFGAAPIAGVLPTARNAERGFFERV